MTKENALDQRPAHRHLALVVELDRRIELKPAVIAWAEAERAIRPTRAHPLLAELTDATPGNHRG